MKLWHHPFATPVRALGRLAAAALIAAGGLAAGSGAASADGKFV